MNAETNAEQTEFLDEITQNEIQIMKFLDFIEFFIVMTIDINIDNNNNNNNFIL